MVSEKLEKMWEMYPESHLHCDVTGAGQNSYQIVVSLIDRMNEVVTKVDYYGSGNLDTLKELAFEQLAEELQQVTNV